MWGIVRLFYNDCCSIKCLQIYLAVTESWTSYLVTFPQGLLSCKLCVGPSSCSSFALLKWLKKWLLSFRKLVQRWWLLWNIFACFVNTYIIYIYIHKCLLIFKHCCKRELIDNVFPTQRPLLRHFIGDQRGGLCYDRSNAFLKGTDNSLKRVLVWMALDQFLLKVDLKIGITFIGSWSCFYRIINLISN